MLDYQDLDPERYEAAYASIPRERYLREHWRPAILGALRRYCDGRRVLDLGCGYGYYTRAITNAKVVVGVDLSQRWLTWAQRHGVPRLCRADAHRLPFADGAFDVIVSVGLLEYVDRQVVLREMARLLAPGGHVLLVAPNRHGAFRTLVRLLDRVLRRDPQCAEPTYRELRRRLSDNQLHVVELQMDDGLVWLPGVLDRHIGPPLYRAVEAAFRPWGRNPLSNVLLCIARR